MKRGKGIFDHLYDTADLQDEPMPNLPLIEIAGDRRVLIEQHMGVTQYSAERICIRVKYGQILILGSNLILTKMSTQQLVVSGCISGVQLFRGE